MTPFPHFGLYFTTEHVQAARQNRERDPFHSAWADLKVYQPPDLLAAAQRNALLYRFTDDGGAGEAAVHALINGVGLNADAPALDAITDAVTAAQTFEMLADHLAFV